MLVIILYLFVCVLDIIGEVSELGRIQTVQVHDKDKENTSISDV